jgi:hypothetical protein
MSKHNYGTNLNHLQERAPHALFIPSGEQLLAMIASAEAKASEDRRQSLNERAERARRFNESVARDRREHDCRRYVNAGNKP